jgi:hypothetical protein
MFQYAAGRAAAAARGVELFVDLSWYDEPTSGATPRPYELGALKVQARVADAELLGRFAGARRKSVGRLLRPGYAYLKQRSRAFDPVVLERTKKNVYLDGYWQSERYFAGIAEELRSELQLAAPASEANAEMMARIEGCEAVCVHVRRGDYAGSAAHGTCSVEYYARASERVAERVAGARFFVFSDDPEWARANLSLGAGAECVEVNPPSRPAEDLRLMRRCRHFIVANSSFSWWPAWLSEHEDKVVVAPARWFADPEADEGDVVPKRWLRM